MRTSSPWICRLLVGCLSTFLCNADIPAASVTVALPELESAVGTEIKVPLQVRGAQGLGPLQLDLLYDRELLEVKTVSEGDKLPIGLFDFNVVEPGRLRLVMTGTPNQPIHGDGELFVVKFLVRGPTGKSCALKTDKVRAWEQAPEAYEMRVTTEPGKFSAVGSGPATTIYFVVAGIGAVLILIFLAYFKTKRK